MKTKKISIVLLVLITAIFSCNSHTKDKPPVAQFKHGAYECFVIEVKDTSGNIAGAYNITAMLSLIGKLKRDNDSLMLLVVPKKHKRKECCKIYNICIND